MGCRTSLPQGPPRPTQGLSAACPEQSSVGVSVAFLQSFAQQHAGERTTQQVVDEVIKDKAAGSRIR